jgi:hypothetical protein
MKILSLQLLSRSLPAQHRFYHELLGFPAVLSEQTLEVTAGRTQLIFKAAPVCWRGVYHFAFNIPHNQFRQAKSWAGQRSPLIVDKRGANEFDFSSWNAHGLYFYDPSGNIVEFIARHDLENSSRLPFSGQSIECISEIGITVDDVPQAVKTLQSALVIAPYRDSSLTFAPLGDENGLLILVPRGRIWYPETGIPADDSAVVIRLEASPGREYVVQSGGEGLRIIRQP